MNPSRDTSRLLEICVESLSSAVAAREGGADRVELCADLGIGGVTPRSDLAEKVVRALDIPVHAMVRPRGGDFVYSASEFELMKRSVAAFGDLGCAGIVTGVLTGDGRPDEERTAELVRLAGGMAVTFHRAIDLTADILGAASAVAKSGVTRILTSGGAGEAEKGAPVIARLVSSVAGVSVIAAGGVTPGNAAAVLRSTGAGELHAWRGVSVPRDASGAGDRQGLRDVDPRLVRSLKNRMLALPK